MGIFSLLRYLSLALVNKLKLICYNEYTIARYFRKQGAQIGENCRILVHNLGSEPYLVKIGDDCIIAPGVVFVTHDASAGLFRKETPDLNIFGKIEIKNNCFIGINSIILPNVTIGPNAIVGAGSIVTKDVAPNTVVAGVPAKPICLIDEYKEKCLEQWHEMRITGKRKSWKKQLIEYFWFKREERE